MSPALPPQAPPLPWRERIDPFVKGFLRAYHRYASWLVSITWRRFAFLSVLLVAIVAITQSLPLFSYKVTEWVDEPIALPDLPELPELPAIVEPPATVAKPQTNTPPKPPKSPEAAKDPAAPPAPNKGAKPAGKAESAPKEGLEISIDERGIRIRPRKPVGAASAASSNAASAAGADTGKEVTIQLPSGATREMVQEAVEAAQRAMEEAAQARRDAQRTIEEAHREASQVTRDAHAAARQALKDAQRALRQAGLSGATRRVQRTHTVHWGEFLVNLALIWILASVVIKVTYKGRLQAEVKAAQATETAEAESLKRQVIEARMAAMQAQIEPHFLFNTLASIDHLIEVEPKRASQMQKNLIALLRASMPTMREAQDSAAPRDLKRELAVIRPYLEILKVRMEERLVTELDVPEGLHSAEFPPMMIQTLVENAIKHGLEPKPEGGSLKVKAEIVHGKLAVSVADTGLGFGKAPTAGTGVGLANIRERLQLIYGARALLSVNENPQGGTVVTITVPYKSLGGDLG